MTAPYVPDGDPCPKHGQPSRLLHCPALGYYSQCAGCRDAFLDWFSGHLQGVERVLVTPAPRPQMELL